MSRISIASQLIIIQFIQGYHKDKSNILEMTGKENMNINNNINCYCIVFCE